MVKERGRSAFANRSFKPGEFVCEYSSLVRKKTNPDWGEERNADLGIGCYCLDATYQGIQYTFDAGPRINDPGRYINHAAKNGNLQMWPVMIGNPPECRLRIGFVAKKAIAKGDELFFDYGVRDQTISWLQDDAKSIATTLESLDNPGPAKHTRPLQDCPVRGCSAVSLRKLADHLRCTHKFDQRTRNIYLARARKVQSVH